MRPEGNVTGFTISFGSLGGKWVELCVLRGGSWYNSPRSLRAASRDWGAPGERGNSKGFRLGRTLTP
jgi:formylglycine-generating enzyme required for sulfatase activity